MPRMEHALASESEHVAELQELFDELVPPLAGAKARLEAKRNILLGLYQGFSPRAACRAAGILPVTYTRLRRADPLFAQACDVWIKEKRAELLEAVEENVYQQALKDDIKAGFLGLQVLKAQHPDWEERPVLTVLQTGRQQHVPSQSIQTVDAAFRELPNGE